MLPVLIHLDAAQPLQENRTVWLMVSQRTTFWRLIVGFVNNWQRQVRITVRRASRTIRNRIAQQPKYPMTFLRATLILKGNAARPPKLRVLTTSKMLIAKVTGVLVVTQIVKEISHKRKRSRAMERLAQQSHREGGNVQMDLAVASRKQLVSQLVPVRIQFTKSSLSLLWPCLVSSCSSSTIKCYALDIYI